MAQSKAFVHVLSLQVTWGHCDPAGIVYFPRYFEMFHAAMESWFTHSLGMPYAEVILGRQVGFPAVHTEADFRRPSALGDEVDVQLRVAHLGRSSLELAYAVLGADTQVRLTGRTVCVAMDLDPRSPGFRRAIGIPDDLRARIEAFGVTAQDADAVR